MKISNKDKFLAIVGGVVSIFLAWYMFRELGGLSNISIQIGLFIGVFDFLWMCFVLKFWYKKDGKQKYPSLFKVLAPFFLAPFVPILLARNPDFRVIIVMSGVSIAIAGLVAAFFVKLMKR